VNNENRNLIIAELVNKTTRKTKDNQTFYILEISLRKIITEMVLELKKEHNSVSINGKEVLFVFPNGSKGNKYAYTLEKGCIYAF